MSSVGPVAPREACGGAACPLSAGSRVLARNRPAAALTNAISWGHPPCSSIRKGRPPYGWKNRGIFAVVGTGRRGLRVCSHVGQLLAPRPHVSQPHGGRRPLIAECRCPAVIRALAGHCTGKRGPLGLERAPWKSRALDLVAPGASPGSCHGAWFSAGECHLRTPWTGGRGCLHGEGVAALGDPGRSRYAPLGRSLAQTLES